MTVASTTVSTVASTVASGPRPPPLEVAGLVVGHGGCALFPPFGFVLEPGEVVCLLGGNGAGKTTLLKTLAGILPSLAGTVHAGGVSSGELSGRSRARRVALLLAESVLPPFLTGRELVSLGRTPHAGRWIGGAANAFDDDAVTRALELLRATPLADRRLGQLSDGERQRLSLARAVAQDAPVLLLDEPLSHLDPPAKAEMLGLLHDWARGEASDGSPRAVLAAVHEVDLAFGFADRCLMLAPGLPPFLGTPEECAAGPLRRFFPGWPAFWDPLELRRNRLRNRAEHRRD